MSLELSLDAAPRERPLSVLELTESAQRVLERAFPAPWVEGEVSNFARQTSGHWYFTLKDEHAEVRCAMFRNDNRRFPAEPENGLKVFARGRLTVWPPRGAMQFVVKDLLPTTEGGFYAIALERARKALEKDGLLDPARKRALPPFPRAIGMVTSPDGAAWRDVVAVIARRWPMVELVLVPARVQGDDAPRDLCHALALANRCDRLDLLIVGRGGGSKEDLQAFNDEKVARAVAAARMPTISAVGHETDVTLTDLVADVRAATPSAAAEKAVPDRMEVMRLLASLEAALGVRAGRRLDAAGARLAHAQSRISGAVSARVHGAQRRLGQAAIRMAAVCAAIKESRRADLDRLTASLDALSPLRVLDRGYSVARDGAGRVLRRVADFPVGAAFHLRVVDGEVDAVTVDES
ncbi:MAG: exodeoxyribonuclease VII large subunit [Gemmatimonadales bacterium]|nr:exodeoxyribonuclease VII large subunit [Gemmatimonadales bacterium]